jgi:hypothetical protein
MVIAYVSEAIAGPFRRSSTVRAFPAVQPPGRAALQ